MVEDTVHWGILAAGGIAEKFIRSARALGAGNEVIAVASNTPGKAEAFAQTHEIAQAYGSYQALIENPQVDAVYVANTHNFHHETVMQALEAGKHVLCEKPLAVNATQVKEMIAKAAEKQLFLMEAMWTRFLLPCKMIGEWLGEGKIGEVRQIEATFGIKGNFAKDGRMLNPELAGGALLDMGIYPISFASFVMGGEQPETIQTEVQFSETGVDADDVLIFKYKNGVTALLRCGFGMKYSNVARVTGTEGSISIPHHFIAQTEVNLETDSGIVTETDDVPDLERFQFEIEHAADCIRKGIIDSPVMPLAETLAIAETMDRIRAQWNFVYSFERG
ncbi:MAG: Gfo/Idh/MocA family protein [Opitutales bacterium]